MAGVTVKDLSKKYHINGRIIEALSGVNLSIGDGSFITVVGRSGCGKTTLLRILCGLEEKTAGEIVFNCNGGYSGEKIKAGIVFQEPRLMPWLTVEQNMAFSLMKNDDRHLVKTRVYEHLDMLGLTAFKDAYPSQISGGMAQRVALGRTLCYDPDLILMDEPLGALDAFNRRKLQNELVEIFLKSGKTIVFVTHDVDEAVYMGQKVVVMDKGKVMDETLIDMPYPRQVTSKEFFEMREEILCTILKEPEYR